MENRTIELGNIPCFGDQAVNIQLAKSNFLYGPNGSGKSSIARKLQKLSFVESDSTVAVMLFNQRYIQNFIDPDNEIPGVFTVRAGSPEIQEKLKKLEGSEGRNGEIAMAEKELQGLKKSFGKMSDLVESAEQDFEEEIWKLKNSFPENLQRHAFKGLLRSKKKFSEEAIRRYRIMPEKDLKRETETEQELESKLMRLTTAEVSSKVATLNKLPLVPEISESMAQLLAKSMSEDSSNRLSKLISKLGNSEWVRSGIDHLDHSEGLCPFCQKRIEEILDEEIRSLFDTEYENTKATVELLKKSYNEYLRVLDSYIDTVKEVEVADTGSFERVLLQLRTEAGEILKSLEKKSSDMSSEVDLGSVRHVCDAETERENLNVLIARHNSDVANRAESLDLLKNEIWDCFLNKSDVAAAYHNWVGKIAHPNKAIERLRPKIEEAEALLQKLRNQCDYYKSQLTSAIDVKNEINQSLKGLGFTSFHLSLTTDDSQYRIVRTDGQPASFLSEGEKTLISFLYFYQRVKDGIDDKANGQKIWVILDDPISSLDSQSLTVISHLCRILAKKAEETDNSLERFFLFTHNAYFYQEAIYEGTRRKAPDEERRLYSLIRKGEDGISQIEVGPNNRIESTYELLWREVRDVQSKQVVSASIQNAMRRILEVYFRLIGSVEGEVIDKLGVEFQLAAKSLLSWINDGSHQIRWDLDSAQTTLDSAIHFRTFREIFRVTGQIGHYNMMMNRDIEVTSS